MRRFSFWKPDPIPQESDGISCSNLVPLGMAFDVLDKILTIPLTTYMNINMDQDCSLVFWGRDKGVMLTFKDDPGNIAPGLVVTINAKSNVDDKLFYRLYVQLFERFSTTLLDESSSLFLTPKQFKKRLRI